ncbi:hypothetical protein SETIT_7G020700v2 [Setaria italica]|uniref:Uncharacterized protein n=1 Tax=Setaria italica TaxID=4555 RepID=A0A368RR92_SETIT|nr:hypothetical protein SETIT_7G020700v2 [Setaria italica]
MAVEEAMAERCRARRAAAAREEERQTEAARREDRQRAAACATPRRGRWLWLGQHAWRLWRPQRHVQPRQPASLTRRHRRQRRPLPSDVWRRTGCVRRRRRCARWRGTTRRS